MTKLYRIALAWIFLCASVHAQSIPFPGPGMPASSASYQGPGDVFATAFSWHSCARTYNAAYAAATGNLCDVVLTTGGAAACTIKASTTGFADLTGTYCVGVVNLATACTAGCSITKMYDQSGNGRDLIQATLVSMPPLTLSASPTGTLPVVGCSGNLQLTSSGSFTQAQPITFSAVVKRTTAQLGGIYGGSTSGADIGSPSASANLLMVQAGSQLTASAADNSWHSLNGLANGNVTSSAINIDGSDATGAAGTTGLSAIAIRICRADGGEFVGQVAEAGMWAASSTSTDRGNLSTNQHSATSGYQF